jgi:hypothetical protein
MTQHYAIAIGIVVGLIVLAKVLDMVRGQPRTSSGQFAENRTTVIANLIKLIGALALVYVLAQAIAGA